MSRPSNPVQHSGQLLMGGAIAIATTLAPPAWSLTPAQPIQTQAQACPAQTETSRMPSRLKGEAPASPSLSELANDYNLFVRVVQNTFAQPRYLTVSTTQLRYSHRGKPLTARLQSRVITAVPESTAAAQGYYRAELTLEGENGESDRNFLVISDGLQTWTLDRQRNQYSITPNRQRLSPFDDTTFGLFSLFVLSFQRIAIAELPELASMETSELAEQLKIVTREAPLTLDSLLVNGQPRQSITLGNAELGEITAFVEPQSAQVHCAELNLWYGRSQINIQEQILKREALPELSDDQFKFVPPKGSVQVERPIELGPL